MLDIEVGASVQHVNDYMKRECPQIMVSLGKSRLQIGRKKH